LALLLCPASAAPPDLHSFPTRRSSDLPDSAVRRKHEDLLLNKLYDMGVLSTKSKLSAVEHAVTVSSFARRRLPVVMTRLRMAETDRKSTRLNSSHVKISYAVFCLKKKT